VASPAGNRRNAVRRLNRAGSCGRALATGTRIAVCRRRCAASSAGNGRPVKPLFVFGRLMPLSRP
jgi:hypothetical protein